MSEALRASAESVQRLCRALAADGADDVAQEAWLAALVRRIPAPELPRWLPGAARRLARARRREEVRRKVRETRAARVDATASAAESAVRLELVKRVVAAVEALDEPYRTAVVLRYFENRPPREIARALGIPVNTARSRVRRGIEALRRRLGPSTVLLLLPAMPAEPARVPVPVKALAGLAVAVAGVALGVRFTGVLDSPPREARSIGNDGTRGMPVDSTGSVALLDVDRSAAGKREASSTAPRESTAPDVEADPRPAEALPPALAEVRGRIRLAGGASAAGVAIVLRGEEVLRPGQGELTVPEGWADPSGSTDREGRFALTFTPALAFAFALDVRVPGHAGASWWWGTISPGDVIDVGEVELPRGATIEGRLVDEEGRAFLGSRWRVKARTVGQATSAGREEVELQTEVDPSSGAFRIEDLPPGETRLDAYSSLTGWIEGPTVAAAAGEIVPADIVYSGPDPARRIEVTILLRPGFAPRPEAGSVRLLRPPDEPLVARALSGSWKLAFDGLSPGAYAIEIDDERFLPWRREGVTPGTSVTAELEGSSAVVVRAFDGQTGAPVERFAARATLRNSNTSPCSVELRDDAAGRIGLVAGDYALSVLAEGYGPELETVDDLRPGETRTVRLALGAGSWVAGRVLRPDGSSAAGVSVSLLAPAEQEDSPSSPILRRGVTAGGAERCRRELEVAGTDASGAFRFVLPDSGRYLVALMRESRAPVCLPFAVPEDDGLAGLELVLSDD